MKHDPSPFTTALFVPQWWVVLFNETLIDNKPLMVDRARVLPPMRPAQLKLLSQIIGNFQQQLLDNRKPSTTVTISPTTIDKEFTAPLSINQRQQAQILLHNLQGLRLLFKDQTETTFRSYPLFSDEHWRLEGNTCQLTLTDRAAELLSGYCDPYAELNCWYKDETQINVAIDNPPLQLKKSLWFDLQGIEQLLYLRLETTAQYQANWLNLEHCLAIPIDQLFTSLTVDNLQRTLNKLGKKLREHGYLARQGIDSTIFCRDYEQGQTYLSWALQDFTVNRSQQRIYRDTVARYFFFRKGRSVFTKLVNNFFPNQRRLADKLFSNINEQFDEVTVISELPSNNLLIDAMLFCEWSLRQADPQRRWPLPTEFDNEEIRTAIDSRNSQPLTQRLAVIRTFFDQHPDSCQLLAERKLACLASSVSRATLKKSSPSLTKSSTPKVVPSTSLATDQSTDRSHLHKIASLELQKIIASSPSDYRRLENSYFASLPTDAKESILEVKRHMQATVFENHLRPRLISFMIDNPRAWERTEAIKELRVFD